MEAAAVREMIVRGFYGRSEFSRRLDGGSFDSKSIREELTGFDRNDLRIIYHDSVHGQGCASNIEPHG